MTGAGGGEEREQEEEQEQGEEQAEGLTLAIDIHTVKEIITYSNCAIVVNC